MLKLLKVYIIHSNPFLVLNLVKLYVLHSILLFGAKARESIYYTCYLFCINYLKLINVIILIPKTVFFDYITNNPLKKYLSRFFNNPINWITEKKSNQKSTQITKKIYSNPIQSITESQ